MAHRGPQKGSRKSEIRSASPVVRALFGAVLEQGWSNWRLAEALGVSPPTTTTWRLGQREPGICDMEELADLLGLRLIVRSKENSHDE